MNEFLITLKEPDALTSIPQVPVPVQFMFNCAPSSVRLPFMKTVPFTLMTEPEPNVGFSVTLTVQSPDTGGVRVASAVRVDVLNMHSSPSKSPRHRSPYLRYRFMFIPHIGWTPPAILT